MKILELLTAVAEAGQIKIDPGKIDNLPTDTPTDILANLLNTTYFVVGALAVIIIILAGYTFATASYDPAKVAIAKNAILYSVIGLIVVILAFIITAFIMGRF